VHDRCDSVLDMAGCSFLGEECTGTVVPDRHPCFFFEEVAAEEDRTKDFQEVSPSTKMEHVY
jgi:hypothetical protein